MLGEAFEALSLVVRVGARGCALRIGDVVETMRPLPTTPLRGAPTYVRGLSVIRGEATPVVDLGALLGASTERAPGRFVVVRLGARRAALAVDAVVGARPLDARAFSALPPITGDAAHGAISGASGRDGDLLLLLDAVRVVPDAVWALLEGARA